MSIRRTKAEREAEKERARKREEMEAMNHAIAEKILGWKYRGYGNGGGEWTLDGTKVSFGNAPEFCQDIVKAWQLVEKLKSEGKVVIVKADGLRDGTFNPGWTVLIDNWPRVDADTAALAISKAVLQMVTA